VAKTQVEGEDEEDENASNRRQKSPSLQIDEEEQHSEKGGADPKTTPFRVKLTREQENVGPWKKSKASKSSLDPITLIEGDLNDISDTVWDATVELL